MKIYTNEYYEICAINSTDRTDLTEHEIDDDFFAGKCEDYIFGYRYEPQFDMEFNENGETVLNDDGTPVYKLDDNGEKVIIGWSLYPWQDYNLLCIAQNKYEQEQAKQETDMAIAELSILMASIMGA